MSEKTTRNILVSAIACSPYLGSEDGVGWHWTAELEGMGNRLTVITRTRFKADIERYVAANPSIKTRFVYVDLLTGIDFTGNPSLPSYAYIYLWQLLAFFTAKKLVKQEQFDVVHHVTFAGIRLPSFMGGLGIPFIFGPVGGGEETPPKLLASFPFKPKLKECLRWLSNRAVRFDPFMRYTLSSATVIGLTTKDSIGVIPERYRHKVVVCSTIGVEALPSASAPTTGDDIVVLYAGRFIFWKGMQLGIQAFAKARQHNPALRLVMVGEGPAKQQWQEIAERCGVKDHITWLTWVPKTELNQLYQDSSLFLFPSLHDSGGMVVLEAASNALPVVCLDIGGPGEMVTSDIGAKIPVAGASEQEVIDRLAQALTDVTADRASLTALGAAARQWSTQQSWAAKVTEFYALCEKHLKPAKGVPTLEVARKS